MQCSGPRSGRRFRVPPIAFALVVPLVVAAGCGFFNTEDDPDPLWGIWMGPHPNAATTPADSARWTFAPQGIYLFYALAADGTLLFREDGYYRNSGIQLILSTEPGSNVDTVEILYEFVDGKLLLTIDGNRLTYRRVGTADEARDFEYELDKPAARTVW